MIKRELTFLVALWKANLLAAMEFRAAFISQAIGMFLNDAAYFVFWIVFFDRFQQVRGWGLSDMFLIYGLVAFGFGAAVYFFGNLNGVADIIMKGQLDYYLALPRPVLLHLLSSRSVPSGVGDMLYGLISFFFADQLTLDAFARFVLGALFSATIFIAFMVLVQSLVFWMGSVQLLSMQVFNALLTFSIYPTSLFDNSAKFILFTILPAALIGALPSDFVRSFTWPKLGLMLIAAVIFLSLAIAAFYRGLRRYESGSAIQTQL